VPLLRDFALNDFADDALAAHHSLTPPAQTYAGALNHKSFTEIQGVAPWVLSQLHDETASEGGKESAGHYVWTDVFVKRNGKWLAVASQTEETK